jgi:hypothetical protein
MSIGRLLVETMNLLGRVRDENPSSEEQERLLVAIDALHYVLDIGRSYDFEKYRAYRAAKGPPLVIATFDTREEADAWLREQADPPHQANVLIAGEYFLAVYAPDTNRRAFLHDPMLGWYLADMIEEGLPEPVATFSTREEADAWLDGQTEPPRQVFIKIAGEYHLVMHHYKINHRAIHPISMAAKPTRKGEMEDGGADASR